MTRVKEKECILILMVLHTMAIGSKIKNMEKVCMCGPKDTVSLETTAMDKVKVKACTDGLMEVPTTDSGKAVSLRELGLTLLQMEDRKKSRGKMEKCRQNLLREASAIRI